MWPFSYFKKLKEDKIKKEQEELRLAEEAKQKAIAERKSLYDKYREYIDDIVNAHRVEEERKILKEKERIEKENKKSNNNCPHCGCTNVIQVYKRTKGEISGSIESDSHSIYSHNFFSGWGSSTHNTNGNIDGSLDTFRINQCKKCGHEWERKPDRVTICFSDHYVGKSDWDMYARYFIDDIRRLLHRISLFDPNKLDNKYNSIEEMIDDEKSNLWYRMVKSWSLELLYYYAYQNKYELRFNEEIFAEYEYDDDGGRKYLGKFQPEIEEMLIKHFGFKKHFE